MRLRFARHVYNEEFDDDDDDDDYDYDVYEPAMAAARARRSSCLIAGLVTACYSHVFFSCSPVDAVPVVVRLCVQPLPNHHI